MKPLLNKLNLGCGKDYRYGYINTDISKHVGADLVFDMTKGLPFKDDSFEEIIVNNALTQIEKNKHFVKVMNEIWRVSTPTSSILVRVPNSQDVCSFQDPMDSRRFTEESFTYMQYDHRRYEQYGKHYGFAPFKVELLDNNGRQMTFKLCPKKD